MMPFAGGIDANANATLLFSVAAAVIHAFAIDMWPTLARSAARTLAVALLAVLAGIQHGPMLLVAALGLSAIGDAFLSRDGEKAFLAGLGCFLVVHLLFITLFLRSGEGIQLLAAEPWRAALAVVMAVFALGVPAMLWRRIGAAPRLGIFAYIAAILGTGVAALTVSSASIIGGAILFLVSAALLAAERFLLAAVSPHRAWMRLVAWALYYAAQLAVTLGFLLA